MSEPGSGSDAFAMRTRAERRGDGYVLNGSKTFVTNAPGRDLFVVFARPRQARSPASPPSWSSGGRPGSRRPRARKMGLRTSPMGEVVLGDCGVPAENALGGRARGWRSSTPRCDGSAA